MPKGITAKRRYWTPHVLLAYANNPSLGPAEILDKLDSDLLDHPETFADAPELPGRDTVKRILDAATSEEIAQYRYVRWPVSFGTPDLPWESGTAVLELLRYLEREGWGSRPTVRVVKWYWRVLLTAPDLAVEEALDLAERLVIAELVGDLDTAHHAVETYLMYAPWRSDEASAAYDRVTDPDGLRLGGIEKRPRFDEVPIREDRGPNQERELRVLLGDRIRRRRLREQQEKWERRQEQVLADVRATPPPPQEDREADTQWRLKLPPRQPDRGRRTGAAVPEQVSAMEGESPIGKEQEQEGEHDGNE